MPFLCDPMQTNEISKRFRHKWVLDLVKCILSPKMSCWSTGKIVAFLYFFGWDFLAQTENLVDCRFCPCIRLQNRNHIWNGFPETCLLAEASGQVWIPGVEAVAAVPSRKSITSTVFWDCLCNQFSSHDFLSGHCANCPPPLNSSNFVTIVDFISPTPIAI